MSTDRVVSSYAPLLQELYAITHGKNDVVTGEQDNSMLSSLLAFPSQQKQRALEQLMQHLENMSTTGLPPGWSVSGGIMTNDGNVVKLNAEQVEQILHYLQKRREDDPPRDATADDATAE